MTDKIGAVLIFILLSWWVIDEYVEAQEFKHVMAEHHAHFELLESWHEEWRGLIDTYLDMWTSAHKDCSDKESNP